MAAPTSISPADTPLSHVSLLGLGDIVTLGDGRSLSVRALMLELPHPVGSMSGFALCGEVGPQAALLSLPGEPAGPVTVYRPVDRVPDHALDATAVSSGVVPYWSPHLPGLRAALGQLGYKICVVRGSVEPLVLLWRNRELVVFVPSAVTTASTITVKAMRRDEQAVNAPVSRVAAAVAPPGSIAADSPETTGTDLYRRFTASR